MKLHIVTIELDGMQFIQRHIEMLNRLNVDWQWLICSGVAEPTGCTSWCKSIPPRFSNDGSYELLLEIARTNSRIKYFPAPSWPGKLSMFNYALAQITESGLLLEMDIDECWTAPQLEALVMAFEKNPKRDCAMFKCRYFLGPNIVITTDNTYGNNPGEWLRAWRYVPGQLFATHEPPHLRGSQLRPFLREETAAMGLTFDHYAYAFERQVAFKETYYGYTGAVDQWRRLQRNNTWPTRVSEFLSWVKDGARCDKIL